VSLQDKVVTQVVRMRPGDVLWVRLGPEIDIEDAESIRDAVVGVMPRDCSIIMTEHDVVASMCVASIEDLVQMRDAIDQAIAGHHNSDTPEA